MNLQGGTKRAVTTRAGSKPVKIIVVRELLKYLEGDEGDPRLLQVINSMG